MRVQAGRDKRPGVAVVEAAIVVPVLLLLLYGLIAGAVMVFTADEVVSATREGARYASVHGGSYAFNTGKPAATEADIAAVVRAQAVLFDAALLSCKVTWQSSNRPGQYVTVEARYQWPGLGPFGAREFVSTSTVQVTY